MDGGPLLARRQLVPGIERWRSDSRDGALTNSANVSLDAGNSPLTSRAFYNGHGNSDTAGLVTGFGSVAPVPLPAAAWLLLSGLGSIRVFRRSRKAVA